MISSIERIPQITMSGLEIAKLGITSPGQSHNVKSFSRIIVYKKKLVLYIIRIKNFNKSVLAVYTIPENV